MNLFPLLTPAGSDSQVQYNNGNLFGADSTFTFNDTTKDVTMQGLIVTSAIDAAANSVVFQPVADSTTFFQVKNAAGTSIPLNIDTTNVRIGIGTGTPTAGYALDVNGFLRSVQTVDQITYPSILAQQNSTELQSGSYHTGVDEAFDNTWEAIKVYAADTYNVRSFSVRLKVDTLLTNPAAYLTGYIYTDVAGSPGSAVAGLTPTRIRYGQLGTSYGVHHFYTGPITLTSGQWYWLVVRQDTAPAGGTIYMDRDSTSTASHAYSANGTAWTTEDSKRGWFKIYGRSYYAISAFSTNTNAIFSQSTNGRAIFGQSTNNYGVEGQGGAGGLRGYSQNGYGFHGETENGYAGFFNIRNATTNVSNEIVRFYRETTGTAADGIGCFLGFRIQNSGGSAEEAARINAIYTNAASGSEASALSFWTKTGGAASASQKFTIYGDGNIGIGETVPETLLEMTGTTPYLTIHNDTHEDTDGGRESRLNFKGEQSGGEETTLVRIEAGHDGAADDEKGYLDIYVNDGDDGNSPTKRLRIDSTGAIFYYNVKSGATQAAAGAAASEIWKTNGHATLPDNVLIIGV